MTDSHVSHIYRGRYVHDYPLDMFADDSGFTEWDMWMTLRTHTAYDVTFSSMKVWR